MGAQPDRACDEIKKLNHASTTRKNCDGPGACPARARKQPGPRELARSKTLPGRCSRHEGVDVSRNGRGDAAAEQQQQLAPVLCTQWRLIEQPRGPGEMLMEPLLASAQSANVEPSAEALGGRLPVLPGRLDMRERRRHDHCRTSSAFSPERCELAGHAIWHFLIV